MRRWDLVVIGGGPSGLGAAEQAARLGARVLLVEARQLGGDSLSSGEVPARALCRLGRIAAEARSCQAVAAPREPPDGSALLEAIRARQRLLAERIVPRDLERRGVTVHLGRARFVGRRRLEVEGARIEAAAFVIATGGRAHCPLVEGLTDVGALTGWSLFRRPTLPGRLLVLGGEAWGLEVAQALARLGVRVALVDESDRLLPHAEPELADALRVALEAEGLAIYTRSRIERVERDGTELVATGKKEGRPVMLRSDALLLATRRVPAFDGLGLEATEVEVAQDRIRVDATLQTSCPGIYAIGTAVGHPSETGSLRREAQIVARNALLPGALRFDVRDEPRACLTDPELAQVGLLEREAGRGVEVLRARDDEASLPMASHAPSGEVKLLARRGRLVGAHLLGPEAAERVQGLVERVRQSRPVEELACASWISSSLSETVARAADLHVEQLWRTRLMRGVVALSRRLRAR